MEEDDARALRQLELCLRVHDRLETSTKEFNGSKRRVNKILSTMHINLIPMTDPIQPTRATATNSSSSQTPASNTKQTSTKKLSCPPQWVHQPWNKHGTTHLLCTPTPNRPKIIHRGPENSIPKSEHNLQRNHPKVIPVDIPDILDNTRRRRGEPIRNIQPTGRPDRLTYHKASNISQPSINAKAREYRKMKSKHLSVTKQASDAANASGQPTTKSPRVPPPPSR